MSKYPSISDFFFCRHCISCGEILPLFSDDSFCNQCQKEVFLLDKTEFSLNNVEKGISIFRYEGSVRQTLVKFKYRNNAEGGRFMARQIATAIKNDPELCAADFIINVPNGKYLTERLYNQSEFLAKKAAKYCGIKFLPKALKKKSGIKSQIKCKTRRERIENVKKAFNPIKGLDLTGKTVLIIDDITTTGSTLNECAKVLEKAGAVKIFAATAARALPTISPIQAKLLDADIVFTKKPTVHYKYKN